MRFDVFEQYGDVASAVVGRPFATALRSAADRASTSASELEFLDLFIIFSGGIWAASGDGVRKVRNFKLKLGAEIEIVVPERVWRAPDADLRPFISEAVLTGAKLLQDRMGRGDAAKGLAVITACQQLVVLFGEERIPPAEELNWGPLERRDGP